MRAAAVLAGLLSPFLVIGSLAGVASGVAAAQAAGLYVGGPSCSDFGAGTQAVPFCTIEAAANVVSPGQTVFIANVRTYNETVTLTRSGQQHAHADSAICRANPTSTQSHRVIIPARLLVVDLGVAAAFARLCGPGSRRDTGL